MLAADVLKRVLPARSWQRLRSRWWRYLRPLAADYCPVTLPWLPGADAHSGAGRLHRIATRFHWQNRWSPLTALCVGVAAIRWPFQVALGAIGAVRTYGRDIARQYGVSPMRQAIELARLGFGSGVPPLAYYRYRLFETERAARARAYLHAEQMNVLYPTLAEGLPSDLPLRHKESFFETGRQHGLPVVPAVAVFPAGRPPRWYDGGAGVLPPRDLVLKPVDMACGRGFQLWTHDAGRWRRDGQQLDAAGFIAHCAAAAADQTYVLQERLTNHPALCGVSGGGLSTIRVVTFRRPSGDSGVLLACLRMATGGRHVDNFEAGGIAAPIDLASGTLGPAVAKDPRRGPFDRHPDSHAPIAGLQVPCFDQALRTTIEAHQRYPWMPFVGWDVVITGDGPLLLEANPDWCVELAQIATGRALGDTLYPEIYLEHLSARGRGGHGQVTEAGAMA